MLLLLAQWVGSHAVTGARTLPAAEEEEAAALRVRNEQRHERWLAAQKRAAAAARAAKGEGEGEVEAEETGWEAAQVEEPLVGSRQEAAVEAFLDRARAPLAGSAAGGTKPFSLLKELLKLRRVSPSAVRPQQLARTFLYVRGLPAQQVGDLLGGGEDKLFSKAEYALLRASFVELLDFTGQSMDDALRFFLTCCNFRLPGEAQKIDRILDSFCSGYCRDNPGYSELSTYYIIFSLVMLNTDLHGQAQARTGSGKARRPPKMRADQFVHNLRGCDGGGDFDRIFLLRLYHSIQQRPIKHLAPDAAGLVGGFEPGDFVDEERRRRATRKSLQEIARNACAFLKAHSCYQYPVLRTNKLRVGQALLERVWPALLAAVATNVHSSGRTESNTLYTAVDALSYGINAAITLGLPRVRDAFARVLAWITHKENARAEQAAAARQGQQDTLSSNGGQHLRQEWYRALGLASRKHPARACKRIQQVVYEVKKRVSQDRRQQVLRQIQDDFGGEVVLVDPARSLVREGPLVKISAKTHKATEYMFFLFNDLIMYASEGVQTRFRIHRVIHLSLCRLVDLRSPPNELCFRIISPQKTITVRAKTPRKKQQWLDAMLSQLQQVVAARKRFVDGADSSQPSASASPTATLAADLSVAKSLSVSAAYTTQGGLSPALSVAGSLNAESAQGDKPLSSHVTRAGSPSFRGDLATTLPASPSPSSVSSTPSSVSSTLSIPRQAPTSSRSRLAPPAPPAPPAPGALRERAMSAGTCDTRQGHSSRLAPPAGPTGRRESATASPSSNGSSGGGGSGGSSSPGDWELLRRYSTFIGVSAIDLTTSGGKKTGHVLHCKLCIRSFALFRRRQLCQWCQDTICSDCCSHKMRLPPRPGAATNGTSRRTSLSKMSSSSRVCDACWGALSKMVGSEMPLLSVEKS